MQLAIVIPAELNVRPYEAPVVSVRDIWQMVGGTPQFVRLHMTPMSLVARRTLSDTAPANQRATNLRQMFTPELPVETLYGNVLVIPNGDFDEELEVAEPFRSRLLRGGRFRVAYRVRGADDHWEDQLDIFEDYFSALSRARKIREAWWDTIDRVDVLPANSPWLW